jgi:tetratricopeptide (TPR) repeat protein
MTSSAVSGSPRTERCPPLFERAHPIHRGGSWSGDLARTYARSYFYYKPEDVAENPGTRECGSSLGVRLDPIFFVFQTYCATALINLGRLDEAESLIASGLKTTKDIGGLWSNVQALLFAHRGNESAARASIARALERRGGFGHFHHAQYNIATAYAVLNHPGEAMQDLREAAADGFPCYTLFASDRNLDNLRGHPDFGPFLAEQKRSSDEIRARVALE